METYHGHVRTPADAIILFEACRIGLLPRVQRRLSEKERQSIRSGSIFVWDEREAGMRRWTDGKSWSASRVSGSFLTYREMEGKRGGSGISTPLFSGNKSSRDGSKSGDAESNTDDGPDGYRYKPDGLMKQSFSIATTTGQHLHLISYYSRAASTLQNLPTPTSDPQLRHIRPEKGMYPESTVHDTSSIPAVTRGPMVGAGPVTSPPQGPPLASPYGRPPPHGTYGGWGPPSPLHTPPASHHYGYQFGGQPYYSPNYGYSAPPPHHPPPQQQHPHAHPALHPYASQPPQTAFDRPPPPMATTSLPPLSRYPSAPAAAPHSSSAPTHASAPQAALPSAAQPSLPPSLPPLQHSQSSSDVKKEEPTMRHDSLNPRIGQRKSLTPPATSQGTAGGSTTTIPGISSLISGAMAAAAGSTDDRPRLSGSVSPGARPNDVSLHKLGFNPHSDARALRDLDKVSFRA